MVATEDREIDLKDLLFKILYAWRQILIAGLIVALALGAFKYVTAEEEEKIEVLQQFDRKERIKELLKQDYANVEEIKDKDYQKEIAKNDAYEEQRKIEEKTLLKKLAIQQENFDDSILLNIDPYNKPIALLRYKVTISDSDLLYRDPADEIVDDMITGLAESESIQSIAAELGKDTTYVQELFSVWGDYTGNYVVIQSTGLDKAMATEIVSALEKELLDKAKKDNRFKTKAKLVKYKEYYTEVFDNGLLSQQTSIKDVINDINKSLLDNKTQALQNEYDRERLIEKKEVYDAAYKLAEKEVIKEEASGNSSNKIKDAIKFVIIGFFVGAILYAGCIVVGYLVKPMLRSSKEIEEYYGYMVLGTFDKPIKKNVIDKFLQKWEGNLTGISDEQVFDRSMVSIKNQISEGEKILILGTKGIAKMDELVAKIKAIFPNNTIDVSENIKSSADDLQKLIDSDKVLLIEERDVSAMKDVDYQATQVIAYEKPVIGCIVL